MKKTKRKPKRVTKADIEYALLRKLLHDIRQERLNLQSANDQLRLKYVIAEAKRQELEEIIVELKHMYHTADAKQMLDAVVARTQ